MSRFGGSPSAPPIFIAAASLLGLLCASCATTAVPAQPAAGPVAAVPTVAVAPAKDPVAGAYRPLMRGGKQVKPTVVGNRGGFSGSAPVRYSDKVTLTLSAIKHAVEAERGPGTFPGRPQTAFSLTLKNGSTRSIDVSQVVVTTTYGSPARLAAPTYEFPSVRDFSGVVAAGDSASAVYAFAIPADQAGQVVTVVDFDALHVPATFTGATK